MSETEEIKIIYNPEEMFNKDIYISDGFNYRIESMKPESYQLVKRGGEYILQGAFSWSEGLTNGVEWRDLPTIIED